CSSYLEVAMKELIEQIAKALVDNPDQVSVRPIEGEQTTVLELRVAQSDLGKVIGKQGRTAGSIRTILSAAGMKLKKRFTLEILVAASSATTKPPSFPSLFLFQEPVQCHASTRYTCDGKHPWHVVHHAQFLLKVTCSPFLGPGNSMLKVDRC